MPMIPGFVGVLLTGLILYNASYKSNEDIPSAESGDIDPLVDDNLSVDTEDLSTTPSNYGDMTEINHQEVIPTPSVGDKLLVPYFYRYVSYFNKTYGSVNEYRRSYENFRKSLRRHSGIAHTLGKSAHGYATHVIDVPATYGPNQFSDMSTDEFRQNYLTLRLSKKHLSKKMRLSNSREYTPRQIRNLLKRRGYPLKWDWRDFDMVTAIKDQGRCGACYAESVAAIIETMRSREEGALSEHLSVQQIMDCKTAATGCRGGDPEDVLKWMNGTRACHFNNIFNPFHCQWKKGKITTESLYPTVYKSQECLAHLNRKSNIQIQDFFCRYGTNELKILHYIRNHGPVTAAVDSFSWMDYTGGVIQHNCENNLNHAVTIVGYDAMGEYPHYIIKNSWGTSFGYQGYVHVGIGRGLCGIQAQICGAYV